MILLARHGETPHNVEGRFQGQGDVALTVRGVHQAHELAAAAQARGDVVRLVCSPLPRARQTAQVVGTALGLTAQADPRFAEHHCGSWTDRLFADVQRDDPAGWAAYHETDPDFAFPGGEGLKDFTARVVDGLVAVTQAHRTPALVVCHRGVIRAARSHTQRRGLATFMSWDVPNGSIEAL